MTKALTQRSSCTCKRGATVRHGRAASAGAMMLLLAVECALVFGSAAQAQSTKVVQDPSAAVVALVDAGQFKAAEAHISQSLAQTNINAAQRAALEFERERMRRILLDFSLTPDQAEAEVRRYVPDLKDAEFAAWDAAGLLESRTIDGRKLYFNRAPSNLFRLSAEARARRAEQKPFNDGPLEKPHPHHAEIISASAATGHSSVAPRRVRVTQSIIVEADAVPGGEVVRAWIPYPREIDGQQEEIRFLGSAPAKHEIAPTSVMQRTVYLEQPAKAGQPTRFTINYELTVYGQYHRIDPDKVQPSSPTPELAEFVRERPPHIVFTEAMRKFSREVVGTERNPGRIAQKLFAAVDRIPWAGALEYSTITNISDYALRTGHADCGQQTLLLMTLLRLNGIPARWQSGMVYSDGKYDNLHDWGMLYLAPYGWVPMDVTSGKLDAKDPAVANFYLGSLDAYRLAFNDDFSQPFFPPKRHFRSETVDSQRGEVEWRGGNLYFDRWDYEFQAQVLPPPAAVPAGDPARARTDL
jgi:transglutaminase-like putative cysteine protease